MSGSFPRTHLVSVEAADEPRESQRTSSILISVALMHSCSRIMSAFPIFVAVRDVQIEVKEQYRAGIRRLTEEAKGSCAEAKDEVRARLGSMEVEGIGIGRADLSWDVERTGQVRVTGRWADYFKLLTNTDMMCKNVLRIEKRAVFKLHVPCFLSLSSIFDTVTGIFRHVQRVAK